MALDAAQIRVTVSADYAPLSAMNAQLAVSSASAEKVAQSFGYMTASTGRAEAATAALVPTTAAASTAIDRVAASSARASVDMNTYASNMGAARVEMGAIEGSAGMMASGLARVAAQSSTLGPLIQEMFAPVAAIAFGAMMVGIGERIYDVYENVVLLKESIEELDKAEATEAVRAASLNDDYEESVAHRLEQQGKLTDAAEAYRKASGDKPLELPKIDDKIFKQFNADFVTFMQAVHTTSDAPAVLSRIRDEAVATKVQLDEAQDALEAMRQVASSQGQDLDVSGSPQAKLVEDLTAKIGVLRGMFGEVQSQIGITGERLTTSMDGLASKAAEVAHKKEEADKTASEHAMELAKKEQDQQRQLAQDKLDAAEITATSGAERDEKLAVAAAGAIQDKVAAIRAEISAKQEAARQESAAAITKMRGEQDLPGETQGHAGLLEAQISARKSQLEGQLVELSEEGARREQEASAEVARKIEEDAKRAADAKTQSYERMVEAAQESANRQLEAMDKTATMKGGGRHAGGAGSVGSTMVGGNADAMKSAALDDWYAKQTRAIVFAEAAAEQANGKETASYQALVRKKEALDQEYALKSQQLTHQTTMVATQAYQSMLNAANLQATKAIMGQETWAAASKNFYRQAADGFIQNSLRMMEQEVVAFAEHKALTAQGIMADAGKAASGAYAATSDIPIVGPVLAPIAAAGAFAAVMAFGSAERGAVMPEDMMMALHKQEMVLPAHISQPLIQTLPAMQRFSQAMDANGGSSSSSRGAGAGGETHHHYNMQAMDGKSVGDFLRNNKKTIEKFVTRAHRGGFRLR